MDREQFIEILSTLLGESGKARIYPCIADLVEHGIQTSRFAASDHLPNRQDVTQYMALWCREAGLSEETCRAFLSDYAVSILAPVSRSSPSAIRHSTKSNVKFIYSINRPFICEREDNAFRAACSKACRLYHEMEHRVAAEKALALAAMEKRHAPVAPVSPAIEPPSVKGVHREQFEAALELVFCEMDKKTSKTVILKILHERGFKTRTGRAWTCAILNTEIRKRGHTPCTTHDSNRRTQ